MKNAGFPLQMICSVYDDENFHGDDDVHAYIVGSVDSSPDGVDGVGGEVADGGELVVVHELGIPLRQWLVRRRRVVHLRQRQYGENENDPEYW